jgi:hypothetical protein
LVEVARPGVKVGAAAIEADATVAGLASMD